jgi:hypothetical protein
MNYYEKLNLSNYLGHKVIVGLSDGTFHEGILDLELINEDYAEDDEKPALGLQIGERLEGIYLENIRFIAKISDIAYASEAS